MIVSIRHRILKSLFQKGTASGLSPERKEALLLWLSVMHAAKDVNDLSITKVSKLEKEKNSYRLHVEEAGIFSFRFNNGDIQQLSYKQNPK